MATRIIVDAGHGGFDNGASYNGRLEKEDNLELAMLVGRDLADMGYDVYYTRDSDVYQSPSEKARIGNASGSDLFVSIHRNSSPTPGQYSGVQTLIYDDSGIKRQIADNVNEELSKIGFDNLGISIRPNLTVLKRTNMPAILVEAGFINNEKDNQLFENNIDEIAMAIANGISETLQSDTLPETAPAYQVQVGLFKNYGNAQAQLNRAVNDGYTGTIIADDPYFAVRLGNYATLDEAANAARKLRALGYDTLVYANNR